MSSKDLVKKIPANIDDTEKYKFPVKTYAGRVEVGDHDAKLFYWFFESRKQKNRKPGEIPLVLWINGGPGGSSFNGLLNENGPISIDKKGGKDIQKYEIVKNPYGWNGETHLIYWDQPVGTGYSTVADKKYVTNEDALTEQFYRGLQGFYDLHPEYRSCPLYLTGESYAGKYLPNIATKIMEKNDVSDDERQIYLTGVAIGDGWMNPKMQTLVQLEYAYQMAFVDTLQYQRIYAKYETFCALLEIAIRQRKPEYWKVVFDLGNEVTGDILKCGGWPAMYDVRKWSAVSDGFLETYLNTKAVKKALHVSDVKKWRTYDAYGPVSDALIPDFMTDLTGLFPALLERYRLLFYTGNFDMACGFAGTEQILQELEWPHQEEWKTLERQVWGTPEEKDEKGWEVAKAPQTFGYVKSYGNLTQVVIPCAGHLLPMDQPKTSRKMLYNWIFERGFSPSYDPFMV
jgi:vitellogenic carboxypeptidase-like protein